MDMIRNEQLFDGQQKWRNLPRKCLHKTTEVVRPFDEDETEEHSEKNARCRNTRENK